MKKIWIPLLFGLMICSCLGLSQPRGNFGVGLVLGEPTGFAWKYQMNNVNSLAGVVGFSPFDRFRIQVDYLWQSHSFDEQNLTLHYGPGAAFGFGNTAYIVYTDRNGYLLHNEAVGLGIRGVFGVTYLVKKTPLDVFFELAPIIILAPTTGSGIDIGFGVRYYP